MFIESLSEFIYIDQVEYQHNNSQDKNYIHFFSRPDAGFNVPDDWNSIIYTSQDIFDILQHRENPIDKRYFRILFYNETIIIKTQDKLIFEVIMINTESFSKNVMFLFTIKDKKQSILYTGNLANYDKIIDRKCFHAIQNKVITELYMDKTLAENASFLNDLDTVCCDLAKLIKSSPDYKFNIMLPLLGYEDFLATLSIKYKIRIMINSLRYYVFSKSNIEKHFLTYNNNLINNFNSNNNNNNNNRINNINYELFIECNKFLSLEEIKQRFYENKIITLQFMIRNKNITIDKSFETCGIYQVNWGPHPTFRQMSLFMKQFNINSINSITDYTLHKYEIKKFNNVNNNNNNNLKVNDNDEVVLISVQQQNSNNNNNNNNQQLQQLGNLDMNQQQLQLHFQLRQQQQQQFLLQNQQQQNSNNNNNTNQLQIIKPLNFFLNKINNEIISISSDDDSNNINILNSNSNTQNGVDLVNNNSCNNNINNNNHNNNDDDDDDTNNTNTMYVHLPKRQRTSNNNNNKKSIYNKMINNNNNQTSSSSAFGGTTPTTAQQPLNFSNYNTNNKQILGTSMTALPQSMMGGGGGDATQLSSSGDVGLTQTKAQTTSPSATLNGLIKADKLNDNSVIL